MSDMVDDEADLDSEFSKLHIEKPTLKFFIYCVVIRDNINNDILYYFTYNIDVVGDLNFNIIDVHVLNLYNMFVNDLFINVLTTIPSYPIYIDNKYIKIHRLLLCNEVNDLNDIIKHLCSIYELVG